mgnify:CR=1 FL=1
MELPKAPNGYRHDWVEYRRVVLDKLDNLETDVSTLATEQVNIRLDIRELKVRAAIWGGVSGGVFGLISIAINLFI